MRVKVQELPPGMHAYRCAVAHETYAPPNLDRCPVEVWRCGATCGQEHAAHDMGALGHRFRPVEMTVCGEAVVELTPELRFAEAALAAGLDREALHRAIEEAGA